MTPTSRPLFHLALALCAAPSFPSVHAQTAVSPAEARSIAKEAYVYGFPMVDSYRIQHAYFVDSANPEFKAPWNHLRSYARVFTPEDKAVQTPNSDTPYSFLGMDLRAEPLVLTVPPIEASRYFSIQLIDLYTFNFDYIGSRTTGNAGGHYLVAGPGWKGAPPPGIAKVFRAETELALAAYRTQLFEPSDIENVKKVQGGYQVRPLSAFLGAAAPPAAPPIAFVAPLSHDAQRTDVRFFEILDFVLQFAPIHPSETELMQRFSRIGIRAGTRFDAGKLAPEVRAALEAGMADAWKEFADAKARMERGEMTSGDLFGTRDHLKNNYLFRMLATVVGIYGNSKQEAMYPIYATDAAGESLSGAHSYRIRFAPDKLPPVRAFWSLTMYELPSSLLVANPLNRYLLNSPMLPRFRRDADGGLTLYVQNASPGPELESNWLPASKGPFLVVMRLYWPDAAALDGSWRAPPMTRVP